MIRGTTPTLTLIIPNRDLRECEIIVTLQNTSKTMNKTNADMDIEYIETATYLSVPFTQEETLAFAKGAASVQVNWLYENGLREATQIVSVYFGANLYGKVMTYG